MGCAASTFTSRSAVDACREAECCTWLGLGLGLGIGLGLVPRG